MFYNSEVYRHFETPQNVGTLEFPTAKSIIGAPHLGAVIQLTLDIEERVIKSARFKAYGGGAVIASMSWLTSQIENKTLEEAKKITAQDIVNHFELEPLKLTFALMSVDALQEAIKNYEALPKNNGAPKLTV